MKIVHILCYDGHLLAAYGNVEVVRGTDGSRKPSPVTEANAGTLGVLRAEVLEQSDPELYREGTWLLSLEVTREGVELEPNWLRGASGTMTVYGGSGARSLRLPQADRRMVTGESSDSVHSSTSESNSIV